MPFAAKWRVKHFGREDLGDGIQSEQALAVRRALVALLGLAVAKHDAAVAAHDHQHHAGGAGVDEHDGAGEVARFRQDRIGRRRICREASRSVVAMTRISAIRMDRIDASPFPAVRQTPLQLVLWQRIKVVMLANAGTGASNTVIAAPGFPLSQNDSHQELRRQQTR